jgi:DNA-binding NarL/FixJ family response regulator
VLTAVEARLAGIDLKVYWVQQEQYLYRLMDSGVLSSEVNHEAIRGVRGKKAEDNRLAIQALQAKGLAKMEVARRLGLSRATIDRYWLVT